MTRFYLFVVLWSLPFSFSQAQTHTLSVGIGTGMTSSYTMDEGINKDPRYKDRYDIKFAPISLNYGIDYEGYGFFVNPGIINIGQNFYVTNTVGGQQGLRKINQQYINIPVAFKLHVIDLAFFKLSLVAGGSFAYLLKGKETVSHSVTKLNFPTEVYPILPSDYTIVYDGVVTPEVSEYAMLEKKDFKSYQVFALMGFRSDWQATDDWLVSFDFRMNYGIFDPRSDDYLQRLNAYQALYDFPGRRRDLFAQINVTLSRYLEVEKKEKNNHPWGSPRKRRPRG
ncbi:outer membrane beta-barrel protein [Ohtaekwangia koreensis]|uniref:Outer membrane protein beta-barrel domain-containing protein n=1 Tax=Ohtaekwangia koreensis TaxID=688867 RepID=A0A1T5M3D7_9BACT|nr:outer membrane beta-barrel protein [Ohtaekwangia koreensis]SKC82534.1 Outer membrane protein beta-barrel domain-containing protein [Ohtaekwangia koreensis]